MHVLRWICKSAASTTSQEARSSTEIAVEGDGRRGIVIKRLGARSSGELTHVADAHPLQLHGVGNVDAVQL